MKLKQLQKVLVLFGFITICIHSVNSFGQTVIKFDANVIEVEKEFSKPVVSAIKIEPQVIQPSLQIANLSISPLHSIVFNSQSKIENAVPVVTVGLNVTSYDDNHVYIKNRDKKWETKLSLDSQKDGKIKTIVTNDRNSAFVVTSKKVVLYNFKSKSVVKQTNLPKNFSDGELVSDSHNLIANIGLSSYLFDKKNLSFKLFSSQNIEQIATLSNQEIASVEKHSRLYKIIVRNIKSRNQLSDFSFDSKPMIAFQSNKLFALTSNNQLKMIDVKSHSMASVFHFSEQITSISGGNNQLTLMFENGNQMSVDLSNAKNLKIKSVVQNDWTDLPETYRNDVLVWNVSAGLPVRTFDSSERKRQSDQNLLLPCVYKALSLHGNSIGNALKINIWSAVVGVVYDYAGNFAIEPSELLRLKPQSQDNSFFYNQSPGILFHKREVTYRHVTV